MGAASSITCPAEIEAQVHTDLGKAFDHEKAIFEAHGKTIAIKSFPENIAECTSIFQKYVSEEVNETEDAYERIICHRLEHAYEDSVKMHLPPELEVNLKSLPDALDNSVYVHERWPLVIDPSSQALRFLKYQKGTSIHLDNPVDIQPENLRRTLVQSLQFGAFVILVVNGEGSDENVLSKKLEKLSDLFSPEYFPKEILSKKELYKPETLEKILRPSEDGMSVEQFMPKDEFKVIFIITNIDFENKSPIGSLLLKLASEFKLCKIICNLEQTKQNNQRSSTGELEAAVGVRDIKRNSKKLLEAAFDGDWDTIQDELEKGFSPESEDAHCHSALSEAACQGNTSIVQKLLDLGVEINSQNDLGRTPLFRAAFNGHNETIQLLLENGADPRLCAGFESPLDVAKDESTKALLQDWDIALTESLIEKHRLEREKKLEERLTTVAEREAFAREKIRRELVDLASHGTVDQLKEKLEDLLNEAVMHKERPRGSAEARDENGQTLLLIAVCLGKQDMVSFLLRHFEQFDPDFDQIERKIYYCNVNAKNNKGWNGCSLAVFHDQNNILELLLDAGCDPYVVNSYNKSAFDFAQDEKDAARVVTKDRSSIRNILLQWEEHQKPLFAKERKLKEEFLHQKEKVEQKGKTQENSNEPKKSKKVAKKKPKARK